MMSPSVNRRQALQASACGFGQLALAGLLNRDSVAAPVNPVAAKQPHFTPRAKRVIFLFMQGGVSHVDSYDYKPLLEKKDGQSLAFDDARVIANSGKRGSSQKIMKPLWKFRQHGETGRWASDLFPEMAQHVDKMCIPRVLPMGPQRFSCTLARRISCGLPWGRGLITGWAVKMKTCPDLSRSVRLRVMGELGIMGRPSCRPCTRERPSVVPVNQPVIPRSVI